MQDLELSNNDMPMGINGTNSIQVSHNPSWLPGNNWHLDCRLKWHMNYNRRNWHLLHSSNKPRKHAFYLSQRRGLSVCQITQNVMLQKKIQHVTVKIQQPQQVSFHF